MAVLVTSDPLVVCASPSVHACDGAYEHFSISAMIVILFQLSLPDIVVVMQTSISLAPIFKEPL